MVDLLKRLNSKNGSSKVIIAVIVAVLIVAAATTGVVIYNHNSNKPEAADTEVNALEQEINNDADTNSSNNGTVDSTNDNVENNTNNANDNNSNNNNVNANTNTNNVTVNQNDNVVNNNNVATNNNAGVAVNQNGNGINNNVAVNQQNGEDTYIQKVIEEETTTKEWENVDVSWEAAAISGAVIPADTATRKPVINLTKESSATNVTTADEITYTITAENTGNLNAKNIVVTDKINEEFVSIISVNDNGNVDNDTLTWNIENINAGEKVSVSFVVKVNEISDEKVKESDKIEITNTAYATGENIKDTNSEEIKNDYEKEIITAEKEAFIIRNGEEVKITKDDTTSVVPGETLKYRVTVKNKGTLTKTFEIKDILPDQVENINIISTSNGNASVEGNTIIWNTEIAKRDENKNATVETIEYTVSIKENATGNVKNAVVIDGEEITSVKTPIVTFSKSSTIVTENEGYVTTDSIVRYDILVTNTSEDVKATSIQVTDMVPVGTTLLENETYSVSDNGNVENGKITWNLDIEKSSTKTVSFYVVVNENDDDIQIKNVAYVNDKKTNETDDDYVKPRYDYVVNYYKDSISDDNFIDKITGEKYINEEVTADITYKIPTGYKFEGETPSMTIKKEGNVLNVVYVKRNDLSYTIHYYEEGTTTQVAEDTYVDGKTFGESITVEPKNVDEYEVVNNEPITFNITEGTNEYIFYYVKDLEVVKSGTKTVYAGGIITYNVKITNSNSNAKTTTVTDTLPNGVVIVDNDGNPIQKGAFLPDQKGKLTNDGNQIVWENISIPSGTTELVYNARIDNDMIGKEITNNVKLSNYGQKESSFTTKVSEITVTKTDIKPGEQGKDSVNIVLVMDLSYSMTENDTSDKKTRLSAAKSAMTEFIKEIYYDSDKQQATNSKATISVITFNTPEAMTIRGWGYTYELEYSGVNVLGSANKDNYTTLIQDINNITLPSSNPSGTNYNGLGTYMYGGLEQAKATLESTSADDKKNVVIFLSDGDPTSSSIYGYSKNTNSNILSMANSIKYNSNNELVTDFYSIGFGKDASNTSSNAYNLLKQMSSDNEVKTSNSVDELVGNFKNILDDIGIKDIETEQGIVKATLTTDLVVNQTYPIKVSYKNQTIITITNKEEFSNYSFSYDEENKILTWDVNSWNKSCTSENGRVVVVDSNDTNIEFYSQRSDTVPTAKRMSVLTNFMNSINSEEFNVEETNKIITNVEDKIEDTVDVDISVEENVNDGKAVNTNSNDNTNTPDDNSDTNSLNTENSSTNSSEKEETLPADIDNSTIIE